MVTITNTKLLHHLDQILKLYYPLKKPRISLIKNLIDQFEEKKSLHYYLNPETSLILTKDERNLSSLRRYKDSPFPMLTNIEYFSNSVGGWNQELLDYGISSRAKYKELLAPLESCGVRIHLVQSTTVNSIGNLYLKRQYSRLSRLRSSQNIRGYWLMSWKLLQKSKVFRLACLNSWMPLWYKNLDFFKVVQILNGLNSIVNFSQVQTSIKNVWIESPKGKWRQLGIPNKTWRLYLHILNMFISYIYSPFLPTSLYDGFLYNRGCKTWWESLLWGPLLKTYSTLIELDFSSGFPNLSLHSVQRALRMDGLIPEPIIQLILTHLKSPLIESSIYPTLETYIENKKNRLWRTSDRSVHMGLGISPIIYVITLAWVLKQLKFKSSSFQWKAYADDLTFYLTPCFITDFLSQSGTSLWWILKEILHKRNPLFSYLNNLPLFQESGLKICLQKSRLVRIFGLWLHPLKSLGLTMYTSLSYLEQIFNLILGQSIPLELKGSTRGRGSNPITGKSSTNPSNQILLYFSTSSTKLLNLKSLILEYRPYFGLLMSKLYSSSNSECLKLNYQLRYRPKSLLGILKKACNKRRTNNKKKIRSMFNELFTIYTSGSKCNSFLLTNNITIEFLSSFYLNRMLKRNKWILNETNQEILSLSLPDPLKSACSDMSTYFRKYSELNITNEELEYYKHLYEKKFKENRIT